jgi:hypothetical protein
MPSEKLGRSWRDFARDPRRWADRVFTSGDAARD